MDGLFKALIASSLIENERSNKMSLPSLALGWMWSLYALRNITVGVLLLTFIADVSCTRTISNRYDA